MGDSCLWVDRCICSDNWLILCSEGSVKIFSLSCGMSLPLSTMSVDSCDCVEDPDSQSCQ